jgi:pilus assembly protein Flp/PilA
VRAWRVPVRCVSASAAAGYAIVAPQMRIVMKKLMSTLRRAVAGDRGATMAEYAILVAVIAIVVIVGARSLGTSVNSRLDNSAGAINNG